MTISCHRYDDSSEYTVMSYSLFEDLNLTEGYGGEVNNYAAELLVKDILERENKSLASRVSFDSEAGCFFAYTKNKEDAETLKEFIERIIETKKEMDDYLQACGVVS